MEFKNGYNFMYQKAKEIYASKIGRPAAEDEAVDFGLTEEEKKNIKLVYENKNGLVISFDSIPSAEDKEITATINGEPVIGPSGDIPVGNLNKLKVGDLFSDIHFNTAAVVDPNDFTYQIHYGDMEGSYILGAEWYIRGDKSDTEYFALVATHIPAGGDAYGQHFDREYIAISTPEGDLVYFNEYAKEVALNDCSEDELAFYTALPVDRFFADSIRSIAKLYLDADIHVYDLDIFSTEDGGDLSYGKVLSSLGDMAIFDYDASWNGKYIGFKDSDYYKEPGPEPGPIPTVKPFVDGAAWVEGSRIWFNTSADWEALLSAALDRGTTDGGSDITINPLFEISSADPGNDISCPYFSKASLGEGTDAYIIQAYETDADEEDPTLIKYCSIAVPQYEVVQGFQNLDSDNAYTPINYGTNRIIHINPNVDQLGIDWNGTMIGIIEK